MRKKPWLSIILVLILFFKFVSCGGPSRTAKNSVTALQKLQAKVEAGVSYPEYKSTLADTWVEVRLFLDSPEAKAEPELATAISKAMESYQGLGIWLVYDTMGNPQLILNKQEFIRFYSNMAEKELEKAVALVS